MTDDCTNFFCYFQLPLPFLELLIVKENFQNIKLNGKKFLIKKSKKNSKQKNVKEFVPNPNGMMLIIGDQFVHGVLLHAFVVVVLLLAADEFGRNAQMIHGTFTSANNKENIIQYNNNNNNNSQKPTEMRR